MGQLVLVRDLTPPMFTYFMTAYILSPSMETRLSRIANNCKTGINESYHHSLAIMADTKVGKRYGGLLRVVGKLSILRVDDEERHVGRKDKESSEEQIR